MLKRVGYNLYAHKSNIEELRSKLTEEMNVYLDSVIMCMEKEIDAPYHIIKVDTKGKKISLIECFDWDKHYEPVVGDSYCFDTKTGLYSMKKGGTKVYHHRWMFVSDTYKGFNLEKSKQRTWLLWDIPEFQENKNRVGSLQYWEKFLKKYSLDK
jgi:hypothetical protein